MMSRSEPDTATVEPDGSSPRVFISYAHGSAAHMDHVRELAILLRRNGIDAVTDLPAADRRRDWAIWMLRQVQDADSSS